MSTLRGYFGRLPWRSRLWRAASVEGEEIIAELNKLAKGLRKWWRRTTNDLTEH